MRSVSAVAASWWWVDGTVRLSSAGPSFQTPYRCCTKKKGKKKINSPPTERTKLCSCCWLFAVHQLTNDSAAAGLLLIEEVRFDDLRLLAAELRV